MGTGKLQEQSTKGLPAAAKTAAFAAAVFATKKEEKKMKKRRNQSMETVRLSDWEYLMYLMVLLYR